MPPDAWTNPFGAVAAVLNLDGDAFLSLIESRGALPLGILILLTAGLSEALGQSVVLFANRVKPRRFAASLLLSAAGYPIGLALLALSTVLLADAFFGQVLPVRQVVLVALWSFAPHLFGALILTPYAGNLIALGLAGWTFAAMVVGIHAVSALSLTQAALCLALGWLLWQLLRRSIGWPAVQVARWLRSRVAGEPLVTDREGLERLFQSHKAAALTALQTDREAGG